MTLDCLVPCVKLVFTSLLILNFVTIVSSQDELEHGLATDCENKCMSTYSLFRKVIKSDAQFKLDAFQILFVVINVSQAFIVIAIVVIQHLTIIKIMMDYIVAFKRMKHVKYQVCKVK